MEARSAHELRERVAALEAEVARLKGVERDLRESEARFRVAFQTSPDAVNLNRLADGLYVDANEGFLSLLGYDRAEVLGRTSLELGIWADARDRERLVAGLVRDGQVRDLQVEFRRKDGTLTTAVMSARVVDVAGEPHVLSVTRDVSERRRAEEALAQSEERYRSLVEHTRDGFFMIDAATGRFLFLNRTICGLCGYSLSEGLRRTVWDVLAPEEHAAVRERFRAYLAGERPGLPRTWHVVRKDGSDFLAEISASGVTFQGQTVIQGLLRDVTERERLLDRLRQSQKLEAVGRLASGIAHDFNNILQGISGYAELLLTRMGQEGREAEHRDHLVQISRSTERATDLVQGLLTFGRRMEPKLSLLDLNQLAAQAARVLERTIPRMIAVETRLAADLWPIHGDPTQLELAVLNLGTNGRDAMPQGGRLTIETRNLPAGSDPEGGPGPQVLLRVTDDGHGMDRHTLEHAFEPFFTTKEVGKGTGLGLALVHGIVQTHGGSVTCRSTPGRGTTFELLFPASGEASAAQEEPVAAASMARRGGETVLLVDDEALVLGALEEFLEEHGYHILIAGSGEEALACYERAAGAVALVILDLGMAGMGGITCLERLRRLDPGARVLVASGYADETSARQAVEAGALGFLPKPFRLADVATRVREILDS